MAIGAELDLEQCLPLAREGDGAALGQRLDRYRGCLRLLTRMQIGRRCTAMSMRPTWSKIRFSLRIASLPDFGELVEPTPGAGRADGRCSGHHVPALARKWAPLSQRSGTSS
jgi:hypothetical protein